MGVTNIIYQDTAAIFRVSAYKYVKQQCITGAFDDAKSSVIHILGFKTLGETRDDILREILPIDEIMHGEDLLEHYRDFVENCIDYWNSFGDRWCND